MPGSIKIKNLPIKAKNMEAMKNEFLKLDTDGNGEVSVEEIEDVLRSMRNKLQASEGEIKRAIKELDRDGDGIIDVHEYFLSRKGKTGKD